MVILCDTSVLIAGLVQAHPQYRYSFNVVHRVQNRKIKGFLAAHSLAEFYAGFTSLPHDPPISPLEAFQVVQEMVVPFFELVALDRQDYLKALEAVATQGFRSGAIYDALILQAAIKKNVSSLITWNLKHFTRLAGDRLQILTPEEV